MLSVMMLCVVMFNVVMRSVMAPLVIAAILNRIIFVPNEDLIALFYDSH
jgi:hypothetical protein